MSSYTFSLSVAGSVTIVPQLLSYTMFENVISDTNSVPIYQFNPAYLYFTSGTLQLSAPLNGEGLFWQTYSVITYPGPYIYLYLNSNKISFGGYVNYQNSGNNPIVLNITVNKNSSDVIPSFRRDLEIGYSIIEEPKPIFCQQIFDGNISSDWIIPIFGLGIQSEYPLSPVANIGPNQNGWGLPAYFSFDSIFAMSNSNGIPPVNGTPRASQLQVNGDKLVFEYSNGGVGACIYTSSTFITQQGSVYIKDGIEFFTYSLNYGYTVVANSNTIASDIQWSNANYNIVFYDDWQKTLYIFNVYNWSIINFQTQTIYSYITPYNNQYPSYLYTSDSQFITPSGEAFDYPTKQYIYYLDPPSNFSGMYNSYLQVFYSAKGLIGAQGSYSINYFIDIYTGSVIKIIYPLAGFSNITTKSICYFNSEYQDIYVNAGIFTNGNSNLGITVNPVAVWLPVVLPTPVRKSDLIKTRVSYTVPNFRNSLINQGVNV